LGELSRAAYETVKELMSAAALEEKGFRPGLVSVVQTLGARANFHSSILRDRPREVTELRGDVADPVQRRLSVHRAFASGSDPEVS
jgi:hypothetical protein